VGTFGTSPFGSDSALDFVEELQSLVPQGRIDVILRTLEGGAEGNMSSLDILPEDVIVAAAVLAANLDGGLEFSWNEEVDGVSRWLSQPIPHELPSLAIRALDAVIPEGGRWWRSWVDEEDRAKMKESMDQIRAVLVNAS
jgi:hypothetical protein